MHIPSWIWFVGSIALATHTDGPDHFGKPGAPATQLGRALAQVAGERGAPPHDDRFWAQVRDIISNSDAAKDADADAIAGHVGFMTYANELVAERPVASGLRCAYRSEAGKRAVFFFGFHEPLSREAGQALLAFDTYARAYNLSVLNSGALTDTSCTAAE